MDGPHCSKSAVLLHHQQPLQCWSPCWTRKRRKRRAKSPRSGEQLQKPPPQCLEEVSNTTITQEKIVFPTRGLEAVPNFVPKNKIPSVPQSRKPVERVPPRQRLKKALAPTRKPKESTFSVSNTTQKSHFPLALSIGRGKKRSRERSTSLNGSFGSGGATTLDVNFPVPVLNNVRPSDESLIKDKMALDLDMKHEPEKEAVIQDEKQLSTETSTRNYVAPQLASLEPFQTSDSATRHPTGSALVISMQSTNAQGTNRAVQASKRKVNNDNFVRLNMKNSAGACRGARNKSSRSKRFEKYEKRPAKKKKMLQSGVDPLDDFVDGVYKPSAKESSKSDLSKAPICARHQRPCKLLVVKKNKTGNKGRKFYVCSLPRGEQCDHFEWADNTVEVSKVATTHMSFLISSCGRAHTLFPPLIGFRLPNEHLFEILPFQALLHAR